MVTDRVSFREAEDNERPAEIPGISTESSALLAAKDTSLTMTEQTVSPAVAKILDGCTVGISSHPLEQTSPAAAAGADGPPSSTRDRSTAPSARQDAPTEQAKAKDGPDAPPAPGDGKTDPKEHKVLEAFKEAFKALGELMKGPLGDLVKEVGNQLASGNFDFNKLKNMAQNITFDEQQLEQIKHGLQQFSNVLRHKLGVDVNVNMKGKPGGRVGIDNVNIARDGGRYAFNTSLTVPAEGAPSAGSELNAGFTGPIQRPITPEEAAKKLSTLARDAGE